MSSESLEPRCGASGRPDMLWYEIVALFAGNVKENAVCAKQCKPLVLIQGHVSWIHLK
jgi:hypothetical protein